MSRDLLKKIKVLKSWSAFIFIVIISSDYGNSQFKAFPISPKYNLFCVPFYRLLCFYNYQLIIDPDSLVVKIIYSQTISFHMMTIKKSQHHFSQTFLHGTKADLEIGSYIEIGLSSNYGQKKKAKCVYLTATLDAAVWGAELASGDGRERIYLVEPTGTLEDDPNLTDKKFQGNPTMSYRSKHPLKVVGEVTVWQGHSPDQVRTMKEGLAKLNEQGIEAIED
jgi:hypothetical protein